LRLDLWRLRLFSFGGYGLALAALALVVLALVVFGAYDSYPGDESQRLKIQPQKRSMFSRKGSLSRVTFFPRFI